MYLDADFIQIFGGLVGGGKESVIAFQQIYNKW